MTKSAKAKKTYTATSPHGETLTYTTTREVTFFTFGLDGDTWEWLGTTTQSDPAKAAKAGRGTNPYFDEYTATPATEVRG